MASNAEDVKELQRAAVNIRKMTEALRNERTGRAEDNRKSVEAIGQKETRIKELEEQVRTLIAEKGAQEEQAEEVSTGAKDLAAASAEAEEALGPEEPASSGS